jgi:hypothetical protein
MALLPPMFDKSSKGIPTLFTWRSVELDIPCKVCEDMATGYFRVNGHPAPCCGSQVCKDKITAIKTKK